MLYIMFKLGTHMYNKVVESVSTECASLPSYTLSLRACFFRARLYFMLSSAPRAHNIYARAEETRVERGYSSIDYECA